MKTSELLKILRNDGWFEIRQSGSHMIMRHNNKTKQIVLPNHPGKEIPKGTLLTILRDAEIKTDKR